MYNKILSFFFIFFFSSVYSQEKIYANKDLSNLLVSPSSESQIIYPIEKGKELVLKDKKNGWLNVMDEKTGLVGWIQKENTTNTKPNKSLSSKNFNKSFNIFRGKVLEMSASIKDAISIDTFLEVKHLGGAAAVIIADNDWFKGRRHSNQAFQVYELWRNQNQSPSFLSFRDESNKEQFIILSGPHRPRYLKSNK